MRRVFKYYKWHIIFLLLILVCLVFILINTSTRTEADMIVGYTGTKYINVQSFKDNKAELELLMNDANGDGKKFADIIALTGDIQSNIDEVFHDMVETESYHIYIVSKETVQNYEDKSVFADLSGYLPADRGNLDVLTDSKGRVYAISLEDNTLAERLGIVDTKDIYIAAASFGGDKLTDYEKNGMNIAGYIVDSKEKYSY